MAKQTIVVKLSLCCAKQRTKAFKTAAICDGVQSVALDGDKLVVIGDGTDVVCLTTQLKKKLGYAVMISVTTGEQGKPGKVGETNKPGNSTKPIIEKPGNSTKPIIEKPGNSTKPIIEKPGNSTKPIIEKPGNSTKPIIEKPGNSTKPIIEETIQSHSYPYRYSSSYPYSYNPNAYDYPKWHNIF